MKFKPTRTTNIRALWGASTKEECPYIQIIPKKI